MKSGTDGHNATGDFNWGYGRSIATRVPLSLTGSGRSQIALVTEKIAVLAPTRTALVTTAARVKPGERRSRRIE
jgi:hypothetical protein